MVCKLVWYSVLHPSEGGAYQYDNAMEKWNLPAHVLRPIQYAIRHVHGLTWHPPESVWERQEKGTGNVKWDVYQLYRRHWTDEQNVVAVKGSTLERDLLREWKIPCLNLESLSCPKFKDMTRLSWVESCGYHQDLWHHH